MSPQYMTLVEFISETSQSEALTRFEQDPEAIEEAIEEANLSPEHKDVLRSKSRHALDTALRKESEEAFWLWAIEPWKPC